VNALLARHRRIVWLAWVIAALLLLAVGKPLIYGVIVPLTAGMLVLVAPGLAPSSGRQVDGRDVRVVLLLYVGVVTALYVAFQLSTVERTLGLFLCYAGGLIFGRRGFGDLHGLDPRSALADLGLTRGIGETPSVLD